MTGVYRFRRTSMDEIEIEAEDIEQARIKAVEAQDYEWTADPDPEINDGVLLRCGHMYRGK